MTRKQVFLLAGITLGAFVLTARPLAAATLKLSLPLGRTAYQTNEQIDLCVVRSDAQALPAADLTLTLAAATAAGSRWRSPSGRWPPAPSGRRPPSICT